MYLCKKMVFTLKLTDQLRQFKAPCMLFEALLDTTQQPTHPASYQTKKKTAHHYSDRQPVNLIRPPPGSQIYSSDFKAPKISAEVYTCNIMCL